MTRDHLLGWHHHAQLIADCMPAPVRPSLVRLVPVAERVGVADVDPAPKASAPAAPKYRCETCCDTGRSMEMVCYGGPPVEREAACPDCDGQPDPDERPAALGDGWIEWRGGKCPIPQAKAGEYEIRWRGNATEATVKIWTRNIPANVLAGWEEMTAENPIGVTHYRLLPQEAA